MRTLFLASLLLLGTGLCAQRTARVVTTVTKGAPAWKTWKGDACAMNHPGAWSVDNTGITGSAVTFLAPRDSGGVAHARVELIVQELAGASLEDFMKTRKAGDDLHLGDVSVLSDDRFEDQHTRDLEGTLDGAKVHVRQSTWSHAGKAYTLSYIADEAQFEETRFMADAMFNSFRFL